MWWFKKKKKEELNIKETFYVIEVVFANMETRCFFSHKKLYLGIYKYNTKICYVNKVDYIEKKFIKYFHFDEMEEFIGGKLTTEEINGVISEFIVKHKRSAKVINLGIEILMSFHKPSYKDFMCSYNIMLNYIDGKEQDIDFYFSVKAQIREIERNYS